MYICKYKGDKELRRHVHMLGQAWKGIKETCTYVWTSMVRS